MMGDSLKAVVDTLIYNPKLTNLKPIILPEPIEFEPVTAGWYIVLFLIVLLALFLIYKLFKRYKTNTYRRFAVKELIKLKSRIAESAAATVIQQVSAILKLTAMKSYSREKAAKLYGKEWQQFLASGFSSGEKLKSAFALLDAQYYADEKNQVSFNDIENLIDASIKWVRRHRV